MLRLVMFMLAEARFSSCSMICSRVVTIWGNKGRSVGTGAQHARIRSARGCGVWMGSEGRSPRVITAIAACHPFMSEYGSFRDTHSQSTMPKLYTSARSEYRWCPNTSGACMQLYDKHFKYRDLPTSNHPEPGQRATICIHSTCPQRNPVCTFRSFEIPFRWIRIQQSTDSNIILYHKAWPKFLLTVIVNNVATQEMTTSHPRISNFKSANNFLQHLENT